MQITLNIKDEKEFLNEVKEIVRAKVKELAREEVDQMFRAEFTRVLEGKIKDFNFVHAIERYTRDVLAEKLRKTLGGSWYSEELVKKEAIELVQSITRDQLRQFDFKKAAFASLDAITGTVKTEVINNFKKLLDK